MTHTVICAYDIADDRERARVERVASRWGRRIQKSVFWIPLASRYQRNRLVRELRELEIQSGSILLIPAPRWQTVVTVGDDVLDPESHAWIA